MQSRGGKVKKEREIDMEERLENNGEEGQGLNPDI